MNKKEEKAKDYSYLHERLDALGWTPENGQFTTPNWRFSKGVGTPVPEDASDYKLYTHKLFDVDDDGNLVIPYYAITGNPATYKKGDGPARNYSITRLRVEERTKDGDVIKYRLPKGAGTFPWFPPNIIEAYRLGTKLDCLVMTEGAIKAFAAYVAGAHVIGLTSITHAKDRDKSNEQLHQGIVDLLHRCTPKKVIYLVDGDCKHFSRKWNPEGEEAEREVDLFVRPNGFFSSAKTMRNLLQDLSNELGFSIWFKHVDSEGVEVPKGTTPPKGLDDLLLAVAAKNIAEVNEHTSAEIRNNAERLKELHDEATREAQDTVVKELYATSGPTQLFFRKSLDRIGDLKKYFALGSAAEFYGEYSERIKDRLFVFNGTKYKHNGKELEVVLSKEMRNYVRVGDTFYEKVPIPNRFGVPEVKLHVRQKSTIRDDHGDDVKRVQKLKAFCNTPSHEDYQPIIENCMNRYQPFEYKPEKGEFPHIEMMMKHIFGTNDVEVPHPKKVGEDMKPVMMKVNELELGYDYMQLLYRQPTQMLPILCLVSKENETGKSTLGKLIKAIYTGNAAFVSSQDLQSDFNEHWISKLVVIIEEAFIEKKQTIERIKDLATASVAMVNSKGIQQQELEVFLHFIINSNNVRNFITATDHDIRYWVRNIPVIPDGQKNPDLEKLMYEEIPAFLYFLGKRTMATERLSRMWFYPALLETEALRLVRESSQPVVKRQLMAWMRTMFLATRETNTDGVILMTAEDVKREVFKSQGYDVDYIRRVIKEDLLVDTYRNSKGQKATTAYSFSRWAEKKDALNGVVQDLEEVKVRVPARPFMFRRDQLFTDAEWEMLRPDPVAMARNLLSGATGGAARVTNEVQPAANGDTDDLPF